MVGFLKQGYGHFGAGDPIGPARWPYHDLFFVHDGQVALEFPHLEASVVLRSGQGVLIWPLTEFKGRALRRRTRASILHFRAGAGSAEALGRLAYQQHGFSRSTSSNEDWLRACVERLQRLSSETSVPHQAEQVRKWLLGLILTDGGFADFRPDRSREPRLDLGRLTEWLHTHFAEAPVIGDLARQAGLSPSRFRAVFLAEHGHSAGRFLTSIRTAEAKRLLLETQEPLKAIAARLGFAHVAVFHRSFRRETGVSPARFRRSHRVES